MFCTIQNKLELVSIGGLLSKFLEIRGRSTYELECSMCMCVRFHPEAWVLEAWFPPVVLVGGGEAFKRQGLVKVLGMPRTEQWDLGLFLLFSLAFWL